GELQKAASSAHAHSFVPMQELTRLPGRRVAEITLSNSTVSELHEIFARSSLYGIRALEPKTRVIDCPGSWLRLRLRPLDFFLLELVELVEHVETRRTRRTGPFTERLCADGATQ